MGGGRARGRVEENRGRVQRRGKVSQGCKRNQRQIRYLDNQCVQMQEARESRTDLTHSWSALESVPVEPAESSGEEVE